MKRLVVAAVLLLLSLSVSAQHTVSGIVSDIADDAVLLDNVSVFIPEFNRFDLTKEGGTYILRNVGIGVVTIQFTRIGYKPVVRSIDTKDSALVINIKMERAVKELNAVSITADRVRSTVSLPWSTAAFTPEELSRPGSVHAMGVLASQPGIDRITLGNGIQRAVVRGLSGSDVVAYQFGSRVDNQSWDEYQDLELNDAGNDAVEVVKGPATLLYGPNAMGGALVWKDRIPPVTGHLDGKVDLGFHTNTRGIESGLHFNGAGKKGMFFGVDILRKMHTSYIQGDSDAVNKNEIEKDFAANSKFNTTAARAMVGWGKKWGVGKLTFAHLRQELGIIEREDLSQYDEEGQFSREQREYELEAPYVGVSTSMLAYQQTLLIDRGSFQLNLSGQSSDRAEWEPGATDAYKRVGLDLSSYTADIRYVSDPSARSGWTVGLQGMAQKNSNHGVDTVVADSKTTDMGLYAMNRQSFSTVDLLVGIRFDQRTIVMEEDLQFRSPSFSTGINWKASKSLDVRLNASSGFSAPNTYQLTANGRKEGGYRFEQGSLDLKASRNYMTDLAVVLERPSFRFTAGAYASMIADKTYLAATGSLTPDTLPVYEFRQADATINGIEAGIEIHPQEVRWIALSVNYGMVRGKLSNDLGFLPAQPADKLVAALTFSKDKMDGMYRPYLRLVASNYAARRDVASFEPQTNGYLLFDAHIGGAVKAGQQFIQLSLSATNLLNTSYYNHLSLIPRDLQIREMGRNICIRIGIPIGILNPDKPVREAAPAAGGS